MSWADLLNENSSIAKAADLIGDRWSLMVLSGCFSGICKFNQFQNSLRISRSLLSDRLEKLVNSGLLKRHLYNENPQRYEYQLTEISRELLPIIIGLEAWADRHCSQEGAPFTTVHNKCSHRVEAAIYCEAYDVYNDNVAPKINPCAECTLSNKMGQA